MDVEYWHRYIAGTSAASGFLPPLACQYFHIHAAPSNPLVPVDLSVRLTFGAKRCSRTVAAGVGIVISRNDLRRFCRHNDDSSRFGRRELAYGRVVIPTLNIVVNLNDNCLSSYCTIRAGRRDRFIDLLRAYSWFHPDVAFIQQLSAHHAPPNRVRPDIEFLQIYWAVRAESAGRRSLFHSHTRKLPPSAVSPGELPVDTSGDLSKQTFGRYDPPSRQLQSVLERKFRPAGHLPFQVWGLGSTSPLHVIFRRSSLAYLS